VTGVFQRVDAERVIQQAAEKPFSEGVILAQRRICCLRLLKIKQILRSRKTGATSGRHCYEFFSSLPAPISESRII
jgi:hypothetical protein